jgi:hypothetical protein
MKRALAWVAGAVGLAALGRTLSRRGSGAAPVAEPGIPVDDPAEELRRTLAASREDDPAAAGEDEPESTLDERRARVHARAQEAIDAMRDPGTGA